MKEERNHAVDNAAAWLETIHDMTKRYNAAVSSGSDECSDEISTEIQESVLSVEVRSGWHIPGREGGPEEYLILLTTGGPALRITGDLSEHCEPESARLEWQDWGTPWTRHATTDDDEEALLAFARHFYLGE